MFWYRLAPAKFLPPVNEVLGQGNVFTARKRRGRCPGRGSLSRGSLSGGFLSRGGGLSVRPPPHTVTCRWYTAHWNAFLLHLSVSLSVHGGVSAPLHAGIHPPKDTPLPPEILWDKVNKRAVCILLEFEYFFVGRRHRIPQTHYCDGGANCPV